MLAMGTDGKKKKLLFVSPTRPALSGHGTSMRAAYILSALSQEYEISLLIFDLYRQRRFHCEASGARQWCSDVSLVDPAKLPSPLPYESERFDVIFVLRLACMTLAGPYLTAPQHEQSVCILDMDDYESRTHAQFARLALLRGETERGQRELQIAGSCSKLENVAVETFDYISLSNDADRTALARYYGSDRFIWLPNAVSSAQPSRNNVDDKAMFTLLFVGTMDYFPNVDGIHYFCTQIFPILRRKVAPARCRVLIVGCRPLDSVRALSAGEEILVVGEVENVAEYYEVADLAIVPLRAGGGTRIKILEAFEHQVPVVSTSAGCEGLDIQDGQQLAVVDTPEAFAARCSELLLDPVLRRRLTSTAFQWVQANHSLSRAQSLLPLRGSTSKNTAPSPSRQTSAISA